MKTMWNAVSVVAVMNVVAVVVVGGWLILAGRLTPERFRSIREMLSTTEAEATAANAEAMAAAGAAGAESDDDAWSGNSNEPDAPSVVQLANRSAAEQLSVDRERRVRSEVNDLRRQLQDAQQALLQDRTVFEAERSEWEGQRRAHEEQAGDGQFNRVVKLLEGMPASQAKDTLVSLMASGESDDAVAYLNAMKPFAAAKVLKAFKGEEQLLATELLQRMKALGHGVEAAGIALDAGSTSDTG